MNDTKYPLPIGALTASQKLDYQKQKLDLMIENLFLQSLKSKVDNFLESIEETQFFSCYFETDYIESIETYLKNYVVPLGYVVIRCYNHESPNNRKAFFKITIGHE